MYVSHLLLGLVATVSAIDIYGYTSNEKCGSGAHAVCVNANPGSCCVSASGDIFRSIGFRAIPTNWNIIGQAYNGGGCKNVKFTAQSQGSQNVCCGGSWYSGGNYKFTSSKRFQGADESCPANQGCASVHRADLMMFEDGSKYNITGLDDILYTEMVSTRHLSTYAHLKQSINILTFPFSDLVSHKSRSKKPLVRCPLFPAVVLLTFPSLIVSPSLGTLKIQVTFPPSLTSTSLSRRPKVSRPGAGLCLD